MNNWIYDIEIFPNVFTIAIKHHETGGFYCFELSEQVNNIHQLTQFILALSDGKNHRMVGFNNIGFDYPVLHFILQNPNVTVTQIYEKSMSIINAAHDDRFNHIIWDRDRYADQLDLFKIHHFDNVAKFTSLKILEFNMRSANIQDLPFAPGSIITLNQLPTLRSYNRHDVNETEKFFVQSAKAIKFREYLSKKLSRNFMNHNDTKIGKDFFIMELEKACPGTCYTKINGKRQPRQTPRESIAFKDIIFPYVKFTNPEFNRILTWFNLTTITETKGSIQDLSCTVDGFTFDFGTGGIHGSIESSIINSSDTECILDLDVTSYYPSLAIVNRIYPEHLGERFCDIYGDLKQQRISYPKTAPENGVLKLALNGSYGDSNNPYSPFYDPKYTMGITVNGQLLLCMLAEQMMLIPGLQMIQINTDGLTVKVDRKYLQHIEDIKKWWCSVTGLELEEAFYSRFFVRDVNNYIAEYEDGKLKRKGAYEYKLGWHQNRSAIIIPKAAEAVLIKGDTPENFIYNHDDTMDFLLRTKVPRSSRLVSNVKLKKDSIDHPLQNVTRYYVSNDGGSLVKIMPPLKKKPDQYRRIGINVGWLTTECNNIRTMDPANIDFKYYIAEVKKLTEPLKNAI